MWTYRDQLATSIWVRTINFENGDAYSEADLLRYWNSIIKAINNMSEDENLTKATTISWLNTQLREFSWAWSMMSDNKTNTIDWKDKFIWLLRTKGVLREWIFYKEEFRKYLK